VGWVEILGEHEMERYRRELFDDHLDPSVDESLDKLKYAVPEWRHVIPLHEQFLPAIEQSGGRVILHDSCKLNEQYDELTKQIAFEITRLMADLESINGVCKIPQHLTFEEDLEPGLRHLVRQESGFAKADDDQMAQLASAVQDRTDCLRAIGDEGKPAEIVETHDIELFHPQDHLRKQLFLAHAVEAVEEIKDNRASRGLILNVAVHNEAQDHMDCLIRQRLLQDLGEMPEQLHNERVLIR
jgi:hypothetical protein